MITKTHSLLFAGVVLLSPNLALAEGSTHPKLDSRFYMDIGAYQPKTSTTLRVDGLNGTVYEFGEEFSLEDDLDFEDRPTLPYALMNLRVGERWRIEAEYLTLSRDKTTVYDGAGINLPGYGVIPNSASVTTELATDIYRLGIGYSFLKSPENEVGVALGAHVTTFELDIQSSLGLGVPVKKDTLAPLPTLGLYGYHAFSPKWLLSGRADLFALQYEDYSGHLANVNASLEYQLTKHVGIGLGYRYVDLNLKAEKTLGAQITGDFRGEFNYRFSGPTLNLSVMF